MTPQTDAVEDIDIELNGRPQQALVHRIGYRVACRVVTSEEADAIESLAARATLGGGGRCGGGTGWCGARSGHAFARWRHPLQQLQRQA